MKRSLNGGESKSATPIPPVPRTPTPDAAKPAEVARAAQTQRPREDPKADAHDRAKPDGHDGQKFGGLDGAKPSDHDRRRRISEAAYYKAERRGFTPGEEDKDWLEAEKEIAGDSQPGKLRPEDNIFPSPK